MREHLDRDQADIADLLAPDDAFRAVADTAERLDQWYRAGGVGPRPPGRLRRHRLHARPGSNGSPPGRSTAPCTTRMDARGATASAAARSSGRS